MKKEQKLEEPTKAEKEHIEKVNKFLGIMEKYGIPYKVRLKY